MDRPQYIYKHLACAKSVFYVTIVLEEKPSLHQSNVGRYSLGQASYRLVHDLHESESFGVLIIIRQALWTLLKQFNTKVD